MQIDIALAARMRNSLAWDRATGTAQTHLDF